MKLLNQYLDRDDAVTAREQLREAGIAALVEAMDQHSTQPSKSAATHTGLWVLLDEQWDDAVRVLEDPAYRPLCGLSLREIERLQARALKRVGKSRLLDKLLLAFLLVCLMGLILFTAVDYWFSL